MGGDNHGRRGGSRRVIPRGANGWQARSIAADAGAVQGGRRRDGAAVRASTRCVPSIRRIKTRSAPSSLPRARDASRNETNHRKPTNIPPRRRKKPARRDRRLTPRSLLFSVHAGARAEGIRAKRRKSGYQLRVTVPVVEDPAADAPTAEEPTATKEEQAGREEQAAQEPIRPDGPSCSGSDSLDDALTSQRSRHLAALDFGPGCDACVATGEPGDRRVVATRSIARGECVVFEAPVAAVKAGEPVASDALAAAFCGDANRRDGLLGGVNSAGGKGSPRRGGSQVEIPSMGAIIGEHAHACADDDVANGGVRCATPGLFPWGGGAGNGGGRSKTRRRTTEFAGGRVPNEWLLTHQLLEARATLCANEGEEEGGTPIGSMREWAGEYTSKAPASDAAERRRDEEVAESLAREIGGGVTAEDVAAVHAAVCANAFALEAMCTRLNYGAGFFRAAAYVNHSCDPNCLSLRLGGNMAIFAARDVAAGEELTHSYLPSHQLLLPSAARRPLLTFDCACPRCARNVNGRGADGNLKKRSETPGNLDGDANAPASALETGASIWDTPLAAAAIEIRTVALACGGDRPHDVLDAFRREVLEAPGAREALAVCPPQAAVSLLEPVLDAHWRAALNAGGSQVRVGVDGDDHSAAQLAAPPAATAAVAARAWRDAIGAMRGDAANEGVGVAAAAEQTYAAAEVTAFMLDACGTTSDDGGSDVELEVEGSIPAVDASTARRALMYLVAAHGDSLACAQEDTLCLRAMPAASAAAEAFERLVAEAAMLRLREPGDSATLPPMQKAGSPEKAGSPAPEKAKAKKRGGNRAKAKDEKELTPETNTGSEDNTGSDGSDGSKKASKKRERVKKKCPHGRQKYLCKDCGGTGICEHGRQKAWCRDCGVNTGELAAHYSEKRKGYKRVYRLRQKEKERRASSRSPSPEDGAEAADRGEQEPAPAPAADPAPAPEPEPVVASKPERAPAANIPIATPVFIMPNEIAVEAHRVGRIVSHARLDAGWDGPHGPDWSNRSPDAGDSGATSTAVHHRPDEHPAGSSDSHEHDGAADLVAQINAWTAVTNSSDDGAGSPGGGAGFASQSRTTAAGLVALLGKAEKDVAIARFIAALAKPSSPSSSPSSSEAEHDGSRKSRKRSATQKLPPPETKLFPPSSKYVSHKALGVSLCFEKGVLDCVHVYADAVDGFSGYRHELPHGLRLTHDPETGAKPDCGRTVVERLGEPTQKGGTGRQIWMTYEHLGLKVDLAAVDWEDGDAPVTGASIWVA